MDPMLTDPGSWQAEDFGIYAHLLRIMPAMIIPHEADLHNRFAYFLEISHKGDLFLDPDIGVATGSVKEPPKYIRPSEVNDLLEGSTNRLLVIYQHVRGNVAKRVDKVRSRLREKIGTFSCCSYQSGTAAILFIARKRARTELVAKHFKTLFKDRVKGRIRTFHD